MQEGCINQCHRNTNTNTDRKRPVLTLKRDDPFALPRSKRQQDEEERQLKLRELSRQLKAKREFRRERAEERREAAEEARRRQEEAERVRVEQEAFDQEQKRRQWHALLRRAVDLGLQPSADWDESILLPLVAELEAERSKAAERKRLQRERTAKQQRQRQERAQTNLEAVYDEWEHVPHVVKFGDYDRGARAWYGRGDLASWNQNWVGRGWKSRHKTQDRLRAEHEARQPDGKWVRRFGKGPHHPQKQPRTWEAAAGRGWRRKRQCDARWDHLID